MQISGLPTLPVTPAQSQRADVADSLQRDVRRETNRSEEERPRADQGALDRLRRSDHVQQQRVESSNRPSEVFSRRQAEDENLPHSTRRALQTFAENSPSPEQQLGIELAGIDTFA